MALLLQDFTCLLVRFKAKTLHSREVGRDQYISATNDRVSGSCPRPCQSPAGLRIGLMLVQGNYVHQLATALRAGLQEDVRFLLKAPMQDNFPGRGLSHSP